MKYGAQMQGQELELGIWMTGMFVISYLVYLKPYFYLYLIKKGEWLGLTELKYKILKWIYFKLLVT